MNNFFRKLRIWWNTRLSAPFRPIGSSISYPAGKPWLAVDGRYKDLLCRKAISPIAKLMCPGYGCCESCNLPWPIVTYHITDYDRGSGCFPLCQECWNYLSPQSRLPYYEALYIRWQQDDGKWEKIKEAVLAGK